jgi:hypothetical protein
LILSVVFLFYSQYFSALEYLSDFYYYAISIKFLILITYHFPHFVELILFIFLKFNKLS